MSFWVVLLLALESWVLFVLLIVLVSCSWMVCFDLVDVWRNHKAQGKGETHFEVSFERFVVEECGRGSSCIFVSSPQKGLRQLSVHATNG